ncbi:rhodanese-like domain-containing protein [Embleya sp. NBC_00896]|uniref:rhodanese-like domain-containing protein n=1 Tax=Embleya sp. NBC_00896 TaxID=2975961 RepID=UPI003869252C|nr:rhodanese-like domain-containing protein [Embleya sp. NBC_00896]
MTALAPAQVRPRLTEFTVLDVRTPGEYATGHIPGAHNVPLDRLREAVPVLKRAGHPNLLIVCASGARSERARTDLTAAGIDAAHLTGGTSAWVADGHALDGPTGARNVWPMERQVRLAAGSLVVLGLAVGRRSPKARLLSAAIGSGLIFSAVSNTCGMATALAKLPHNRPAPTTPDLATTLTALDRH